METVEDDAIESFGCQHERHFVDARDVFRRDDGFLVDIAEQRDLLLDVLVEEAISSAEQNVRLNTDRTEVANAVLRRLGLQFAGGADERDERQVNVERVLTSHVLAQLTNRFDERKAFDVADRSADLDQHDVDISRDRPDAVLDLVGDVRNDLHRPTEIVSAAFLLNDRQINLPGRPVVVAPGDGIREALVVTEIEIRFRAVVGHVHFAVLVRAHRARIDVDVRIEFLQRDPIAVSLEQRADRCRRQPLAQ